MPYASSLNPQGISGEIVASTPEAARDMAIKIISLVRRQMIYGFQAEKDSEGQTLGTSVVKLARRNAFELVGLKRPALEPAWRWKTP